MSFLAVVLIAFQQVEVRAYGSQTWFTGSMTFDEAGLQGNRVEFSPDPGVVPGLELNWWAGASRLFVDARHLALKGRETLEEDRRWNDTVFGAGDKVDMEFRWNRVRLGLDFGSEVSPNIWLLFAGRIRYDTMRFRLESAAQGKDDEAFGFVSLEYGMAIRAALSQRLALEAGGVGTYTDPLDEHSNGGGGFLGARWMPGVRLALTVAVEGEILKFKERGAGDRNRISYEAIGVTFGIGISF